MKYINVRIPVPDDMPDLTEAEDVEMAIAADAALRKILVAREA